MAELLIALIAGSSGVVGAVGAQIIGAKTARDHERARLTWEQQRALESDSQERLQMQFAARLAAFTKWQVNVDELQSVVAAIRWSDDKVVTNDHWMRAAPHLEAGREACAEIALLAPSLTSECKGLIDSINIFLLSKNVSDETAVRFQNQALGDHRRVLSELHEALTSPTRVITGEAESVSRRHT